jgi:hypothetical protein
MTEPPYIGKHRGQGSQGYSRGRREKVNPDRAHEPRYPLQLGTLDPASMMSMHQSAEAMRHHQAQATENWHAAAAAGPTRVAHFLEAASHHINAGQKEARNFEAMGRNVQPAEMMTSRVQNFNAHETAWNN